MDRSIYNNYKYFDAKTTKNIDVPIIDFFKKIHSSCNKKDV